MATGPADLAAWNAAINQLDPAPKQRNITRADLAALETPTTLADHLSRYYKVRAHLTVVGEEIRRIHYGEGDRLAISLPPQIGKTLTAVVWGAFWWLCKNPTAQIIIVSYNDQRAVERGHAIRRLVEEYGTRFGLYLDPSSRAKHSWATTTGGAVRSLGIGSGIAGVPGDVVWIDDPHKSWEEAESPVMRQKVHDAYAADISTRLAPFAPVILIQCMTGDTPVLMGDGREKSLRDVRPGDTVATFEGGALTTSTVRNWANQGPDSIYAIMMKSGRVVRANARHPFLVIENGEHIWRRTDMLKPGGIIQSVTGGSTGESLAQLTDAVLTRSARACACPTTTSTDGPAGFDRHQTIPKANERPTSSTDMASLLTNTTPYLPNKTADVLFAGSTPLDETPGLTGTESCVSTTTTTPAVCEDCCATTATLSSATASRPLSCAPLLTTWSPEPDEVVKVVLCGTEDVYDIQIDRTENFIANGLVSHNTRWHEDDLAGRRIREEGDSVNGGRWRVVSMPALCTDPQRDPLGRAMGEPLPHPKIQEGDTGACLRHWEDKRASNPPRVWFALYQGDPKPAEGALLEWALVRERRCYEHGGTGCAQPKRIGVGVDPSGGGRDTAGIIGGYLGEDDRLHFTHDRSGVMSSDMWGRKACELAAEIDADCFVIETNYGGDQATLVLRTSWDALRRENPTRYSVFCPRIIVVHSKRGKLLRAEPIAQQWVEDRIRTAQYLPDFEAEWVTWRGDGKHQSPGRIDAGVHLAYEFLPIPSSGETQVADYTRGQVDLTRGLSPGDIGLIR